MRTSDFDFHLPPELIAQEPALPRGASRLLCLDRATGELSDEGFSALAGYLRAGDLLVVNDSRVIPARLMGSRASGGKVELFLTSREGEGVWKALVRASKKIRDGELITLDGEGSRAEVVGALGEGGYLVRLSGRDTPEELIKRLGRMPLPPYIRRQAPREEDKEWYQTVYADKEKAASVAAPTAGLHFSEAYLRELAAKGIERACITLHVGLGTFMPVRVEEVSQHRMHTESYEVSGEAALAVNRALAEGRRVVAVGTTATRVLEHAGASGLMEAGTGETALFITPGYRFRIVGALLTNFHLPRSTLFMLVSAFGGRELAARAYEHAVAQGYRFYSYGDAMFIY